MICSLPKKAAVSIVIMADKSNSITINSVHFLTLQALSVHKQNVTVPDKMATVLLKFKF